MKCEGDHAIAALVVTVLAVGRGWKEAVGAGLTWLRTHGPVGHDRRVFLWLDHHHRCGLDIMAGEGGGGIVT
ncbi:hypothetical protein D3C80_2135480 [compost metagenome]|jgi:hypothetical protein